MIEVKVEISLISVLYLICSLFFTSAVKALDNDIEKIKDKHFKRFNTHSKLLNFKWYGDQVGQPYIARFEDKEKNATCWYVVSPSYDSIAISCLPNKN